MRDSWTKLIKEIKKIQRHRNKQFDEYQSLGDTFVMLENSCIGKCGATEKDYWDAVAEYWEIVDEHKGER